MTWTEPAAQLWHIEFALLAALIIVIASRHTAVPAFEALILCDGVFDGMQLVATRTHHLVIGMNISYAWYLFVLPLMALSLLEARETQHKRILCWWVSFTAACLGIRYFPLSGRVLLAGNCVAYIFWIRYFLR